mmetsp:Transcript_29957/g.99344  ORF Transcript_29957/g.99344 Transcript_29957/m.99344 type:complete len:215 (+) Transcript_29957:48-692(+)
MGAADSVPARAPPSANLVRAAPPASSPPWLIAYLGEGCTGSTAVGWQLKQLLEGIGLRVWPGDQELLSVTPGKNPFLTPDKGVETAFLELMRDAQDSGHSAVVLKVNAEQMTRHRRTLRAFNASVFAIQVAAVGWHKHRELAQFTLSRALHPLPRHSAPICSTCSSARRWTASGARRREGTPPTKMGGGVASALRGDAPVERATVHAPSCVQNR